MKPPPLATALDSTLSALENPPPISPHEPWAATSLAAGTIGVALAHIEHAHANGGDDRWWVQAHRWVRAATAHQVDATDVTALYLGLPAVTFALHTAGRYRATTDRLSTEVVRLTHRRVNAATDRLRSGQAATFAEYDLFYGLTGLGALLLRTAPEDDALGRLLTHMVALTRPRTVQGHRVPGWWVGHDPRRGTSPHFPQGHANLGMAHGMSGVLALLALAKRKGVTVRGQDDAILTLLEHLESWCQVGSSGPWWPEHLTLREVATGCLRHGGPHRPSWCYGTPGIARAGQLAALALGDRARQEFFEHALERCLADSAQLDRIVDAGLCHGWAGLYQTTWRAASESASSALAAHLPHLARSLTDNASNGSNGQGLLEGDTGTALALMTIANADTLTGWDRCLLIS